MESLGSVLISFPSHSPLAMLIPRSAFSPSLARPAHTLYLHHLTASLETAIRSSTARNDSADVLHRLDARMLEHSDSDTGWDAFSLVYKVEAPVDTVLDPKAMIQYQRLFNHLWKMKRLESVLTSAWRKVVRAKKDFTRTLPGTHLKTNAVMSPLSLNYFSYAQITCLDGIKSVLFSAK